MAKNQAGTISKQEDDDNYYLAESMNQKEVADIAEKYLESIGTVKESKHSFTNITPGNLRQNGKQLIQRSRNYNILSKQQYDRLEAMFSVCKYVTPAKAATLSLQMNIPKSRIIKWFACKRYRTSKRQIWPQIIKVWSMQNEGNAEQVQQKIMENGKFVDGDHQTETPGI